MPTELDLQTLKKGDELSEESTTNINYKLKEVRYYKNVESNSAKIFDNRIWRVKDVANYLGYSIGHIYNLCADEKIPKIKKGKFLYFIPERIYEWVLRGDLQ